MNPAPTADSAPGERRLAAIMFTDVAGYSARMQRDEEGTLGLVRADFARMRERCAEHGGEVLKSTGDGLLLCFPSVVGAVNCALQVQADFGHRAPDALRHRVGIHLGDVYLGGGDVMGDGVNLAARLQTKAPPGGICISESVYQAVKGKVPMQATPLGPQSFKNIAEPMPVYVLGGSGPEPSRSTRPGRPRAWWMAITLVIVGVLAAVVLWRRAPTVTASPTVVPDPAAPKVDPRSIAVLPFANMSEEKDTAFFADGVHEDILTHLAHIASLRVVSRTSVAQYRDTRKSIRQIAAELNVAYVLEGSVRRSGNVVRVTGQLIRAVTDEHVWAQAYDRELKDVFAIQAALATEIASALQATISPEQKNLLTRVPTKVPAAYDLLLQARGLLNGYLVWDADFEAKLRRAENFLQSAVELDPDYAEAWSYLANVRAQIYFFGFDQAEDRRSMARRALENAERLAPDEPAVIRNGGAFYYFAFRDYVRADAYYRRLLAIQPNDSEAHTLLGLVCRRFGKWPEALAELKQAHALDPTNRQRQVNLLATLVFGAHRFEEGRKFAAQAARKENDPLGELTLDYDYLPFYARGSTQELADHLARIPADQRTRPEYRQAERDLAAFRGNWAELARLDAAMGPDAVSAIEVATTLAALGRTEEARQRLKGEAEALRQKIQQQPDNFDNYSALARVEAIKGRKSEALTAIRDGESRLPASGDRMEEGPLKQARAFVLAWCGEKDEALRILAVLVRSPYGLPAHTLQTSPEFAPLHGDPRFETLVRDPANSAPLF